MVKLLTYCLLICLLISMETQQIKAGTNTDCINLGVLAELKKTYSDTPHRFGLEITNGVKAGIEYLKQKNNGRCFNQIDLDIGGTISNIPEIILKEKRIKYYIGLGLSHYVSVALNALNQTKGLLITPTAANDELNYSGSRSIMMFPRNSMISKELTQYAFSKGIKNVITVYAENSKTSINSKNGFRKHFSKLGGKVVGEFAVRRNTVNLSQYLNKMKKLEFSHVFLPLLELEATKAVNFFIQNKLTSSFIGTNGWGNYYEVMNMYLKDKEFNAILPLVYTYRLRNRENDYFIHYVKDKQSVLPSHLSAFSFDSVLLLNKLIETCPNIVNENIELCLKKSLPLNSTTGLIKDVEILNLKRDIKIYEYKNTRK